MSYLRSKRNTHRKLIGAICGICAVVGAFFLYVSPQSEQKVHTIAPKNPLTLQQNDDSRSIPRTFSPPMGSIFVPYWKVGALEEPFLPKNITHSQVKSLIYFGVSPDISGNLQQSEPGYARLSLFSEKTQSFRGKKLLAVRMMDEAINDKILASSTAQSVLINDLITIMKEYSFDGIVLDLEHSVLPTSEVVTSITTFLENVANSTHAGNKIFAVTLYGDVFYRQRPYEVKKIASFSDEIFIMSYDFHKSYGEPGPNFPLYKGDVFSYDFATMINEFVAVAPPEKLTILFGLYGYDWSVDAQNRPLTSAQSRSLSQIEHLSTTQCETLTCSVSRHNDAYENSIEYTAEDGQRHIIWYEDIISIQAKTAYLSTKNINSIGYWAFGYY